MGKIPPQAKRVFQGVIFDVYQWEQTLYDGKTTTTFEMLKRNNSAMILVIQGERILVTRDSQPHRPTAYTFPGGSLNDGETPEAGARRELLDETGYEVRSLEPLWSFEPSNKIEWTIHYFIGRDPQRTRTADPGAGELVKPEWFTWDKFLAVTKRPDFLEKDVAIHLYQMSGQELEQFRQRLFGE